MRGNCNAHRVRGGIRTVVGCQRKGDGSVRVDLRGSKCGRCRGGIGKCNIHGQ